MMADLMGDHVGLREVAGRAELIAQLVVEGQIDIDLPVVGAVKRSGLGACLAAGRVGLAGEQHHLGWRVGQLVLAEHFSPEILGVFHHHAHEVGQLVLSGRRRRERVGVRRAAATPGALPARTVDQAQRINAKCHRDDDDDDDQANTAETATRATGWDAKTASPLAKRIGAESAPKAPATAALATPIFNIRAPVASLPLHADLHRRCAAVYRQVTRPGKPAN